MKNYKKILFVSLIGNALEFYDFTLCGVFMFTLGQKFFPTSDTMNTTLAGIFAFSAAFYTRPFGALFFGYVGDRIGRKRALSLTVLLMSIPTLIIALLPGYEMLGIAAPIILIGCRLLQGLCTGGEYNGAAVFALEQLKVRGGLISGLISASCVVGALTATAAAYGVNSLQIENSWRLPFLFGAIVAWIAYLMRLYMYETLTLDDEQKKTVPLFEVLKRAKFPFAIVGLSGAFNGVLSYTLFGFGVLYMQQYLGFEKGDAFLYSIFGMSAFMLSCVGFGRLSDFIGTYKAMQLSTALAIVFGWIAFALMAKTDFIITGQILLGTAVGSFVGPSHAFFQEQFPKSIRYTGIATGFSLGMAITGASTAFILTTLLEKTNWLMIPAAYITLIAVVWSLFLIVYRRVVINNRQKDIITEEIVIQKKIA